MSHAKKIFKNHQAQTFPTPSCLEIKSAKGSYLYDLNNKKYLDFVSGVSACTLGHSHPYILDAINSQLNKYTHVMVYGEYIQKPQYELAHLLANNLPNNLDTTYFTNSGTEAIEGAMKLAKRITGRSEIISCKNSYHGSTQGSLSVMGNEKYKAKYRPLLPNCNQIEFNSTDSLNLITKKTAAVIIEPIQGASGCIVGNKDFFKELNKKCKETNTLIIFDEIQTCFGRTGNLFGFEYYEVIPDILCIAKGMGGGMPIGAFISSKKNMQLLSKNPELGHITTFGGHPVNCAASLATLKFIIDNDVVKEILIKEKLFRKHLKHPKIKQIRGKGLMLSLELDDEILAKKLVEKSIKKGLILFYFLFTKTAVRISPALNISKEEIKEGCSIIIDILNS